MCLVQLLTSAIQFLCIGIYFFTCDSEKASRNIGVFAHLLRNFHLSCKSLTIINVDIKDSEFEKSEV